tara:strand:+ start:5093 stop:6700 length:1608 start_codon:yes stop_codon:yes gene_type:complete
MNNADLIVKTLKKAGIKYGFGIPSGNVLPLMEAMRKGGIQFVLTAHEGSASFAADVMGRLTGKPGFCISTLGPGATNLSTGIGSAFLDRSPVIGITCNLKTEQLGRRIQMYIDHHKLFEPITKSSLAFRKNKVSPILQKSLEIVKSEPFGPVHLDLPEDIALLKTNEKVPLIPKTKDIRKTSSRSIQKAIKILNRSDKPIAILGASTTRMKNPNLILKFLENLQIPFASTTMAKGIISEDHPLSIGCIERGKRQIQREFLSTSDLIVGLGYDVIEVEYEAWIKDTPLLSIDIEKADTDNSVEIAHEVIGNLDFSIQNLSKEIGTRKRSLWDKNIITKHKVNFQKGLRPRTKGFAAHEAIDIVRHILPKNGIISFDVGAHTHQIASQWTAYEPKTFLITNGWSSMGFGLPGAISAKLASPDRQVVALIGDGCFQMTCGELAVAKRLNITLPVVVLDDSWLSLIQVKQDRRSYELYGTKLNERSPKSPPSHYFGVPAYGANTPDDLEKLLKKAFKNAGPSVIEAKVNPEHYMETVFD